MKVGIIKTKYQIVKIVTFKLSKKMTNVKMKKLK